MKKFLVVIENRYGDIRVFEVKAVNKEQAVHQMEGITSLTGETSVGCFELVRNFNNW